MCTSSVAVNIDCGWAHGQGCVPHPWHSAWESNRLALVPVPGTGGGAPVLRDVKRAAAVRMSLPLTDNDDGMVLTGSLSTFVGYRFAQRGCVSHPNCGSIWLQKMGVSSMTMDARAGWLSSVGVGWQ